MFTFSLFRPLLLLFFFLCASSSYASNLAPDITWTLSWGGTAVTRVSPRDACWDFLVQTNGASFKQKITSLSYVSNTRYNCNVEYYHVTPSQNVSFAVNANKSCYSPYVMDQTSGLCSTCPTTSGQTKEFKGDDSPLIITADDVYVGWSPDPDSQQCFDACYYTGASSSSCYRVSGSTDTGFCNFVAAGTGYPCTASDSLLASVGDPLLEPEPDPDPDPCVTDPASCEPPPDPCLADPASCEPGGGDTGGGDTGGGDTGGGDTGGDTDGGTDTTVDPTPGPGTQPGEPGTGTGDSVASGMACDQPTVCQGDAIQCAILSQQKALRCADVESEDYAAQEGAIKSLVDGPEFELEETQVAAPSLLDQHARFLPASSCPEPETFSLSSNGGHSFQFSYEPICTMASDLSWLIVAFATLSAALYIGRSFGGG